MDFDPNELREVYRKIKKHPAYPYVILVLRSSLIYFLYLITTAIAAFFSRQGNVQALRDLFGDSQIPHAMLVFVISCFLLNSTILNFANFDRTERLAFMESHADNRFDPAEEKRAIRRSSKMWIEIAVICSLFFCFTSPWHFAFSWIFDLIEMIPWMPRIPGLIRRVVSTTVFFGLSYWLETHARLQSRAFWINMRRGDDRGRLWESAETRLKRTFSYFTMVRKLAITYVVIACLGAAVFSMVLAMGLSFIPLMLSLPITLAQYPLFWVAVVILFLLTFGLAIRKRLIFLVRLRTTCKKYGFRLVEMKHPILALFRDSKGYTFCMEANGETYYCRLIASVKRSNKMIFQPDGTATRNLSFYIPSPMAVARGGFVQMHDRGNGDGREFARYAREFRYDFECGEGQKVLLLNPVPRRALYEHENGHQAELDNGHRIGQNRDYMIFSGNAFLRLLKRQSIRDIE